MNNKHKKVESRNETFTDRTATKIWHEVPSKNNPYIPSTIECHGYDLFELMKKRSFVDTFFLLFKGELPEKHESKILETLMIALINPGPRHLATRAAMNTAVGKTNPMHILPVGLSVLGGKYLGGADIDLIMRFFRKNNKSKAKTFIDGILDQPATQDGSPKSIEDTLNENILGFGKYYGGIDTIAEQIIQCMSEIHEPGPALKWGITLNDILKTYGSGWLITGVAAAVFSDLGFHPRAGGSLFQLLGAPGLAAHGVELSNKNFTAMPYVKDENYVIE